MENAPPLKDKTLGEIGLMRPFYLRRQLSQP
jgi:hypothetical protein